MDSEEITDFLNGWNDAKSGASLSLDASPAQRDGFNAWHVGALRTLRLVTPTGWTLSLRRGARGA